MRPLLVLLLCLPLAAAEKAGYDSNGRIVSLISPAGELEFGSGIAAVLPNGKSVSLLTRRDDSGVARRGDDLAWSTAFTLPDGGRGRLEWKSEESGDGVRYAVTVTAESALEVESIDLRFDLPRPEFAGGTATAPGAAPVTLARVTSPVLFRGDAESVRFQNAAGNLSVDAAFAQPAALTLIDRWDAAGRSFQLRAAIVRGPLAAGRSATLAATLRLENRAGGAAPVHITVNPATVRFHFDGFGGNYCWNNQSPIAAYTLSHLKSAWARAEWKAQQWDRERKAPGKEIRADLENMRKLQQMGAHLVLSVWWLPERFYTDPYDKPRSAHARIVNPEKWDELLDLLGSYLAFAKREYGVEPDLFSFNESDIGIYVGLTPESQTAAIKRIGAYFAKAGFKTRMLLGDTGNPRDTHKFVLTAASDPDALPYIGAVAFHSWGGATPEQYSSWGEVAEWLHLPLLVTEMGVDAAAYHTRAYNSYSYGLKEARMAQELLLWAHPQGALFWQFTNDYALARQTADGGVEPTARFYLMKHFTDLTPPSSDAIAAASDEAAVLVTAFRKERAFTVHILNPGAARDAIIEGLPDGDWLVVETTEEAQFHEGSVLHSSGAIRLHLPARALISLKTNAP
jgi:hypothetical protein